MKRGRQAEHDTGRDRHDGGERQDPSVDADGAEECQVDRNDLEQHRDGAVCDRDTEHATDRRPG
jgi:hypothetical protein